MNKHADELLARIRALQDELEEEYRARREEWAQKRDELADEFLPSNVATRSACSAFWVRSRLLD